MKKLDRKSFAALKSEFSVLPENELTEVVGGQDPTSYTIASGTFVSYYHDDGDYTVYYPNDGGQSIVFDGVTVSDGGPTTSGVPCQTNGVVHMGKGYNACSDVETFIHEFGHYLQQEEYGDYYYYTKVVIGSGYATYKQWIDPSYDYYSYPTEKEASELGQAYMDYYYPDAGYYAPGINQTP